MIPEGTYAAVVAPVETETGTYPIQWGPATKNSPFQAAVCFEILRGPQAGQKITAFLYFSEKAAQRSMESLRACGFKGDDIDKFVDQAPDIECEIVVEHEMDNEGKLRAKVKWINGGNRGFKFKEPLDARSLRKFSAEFRGTLKQIPPVVGKKAERQPPTPATANEDGSDYTPPMTNGAPPAADDDIPF